MQSMEPVRDRAAIPMTVERAMTAITQCWVAAERAHRQMVEALQIMKNLGGDSGSSEAASERASRVLPLPRLLDELVEMRANVLDHGDRQATPG